MKKNIIITMLAILVLGLGGYLVYDKIISKEDVSVKEEQKETEQKTNIKVDDSKGYVYDSTYRYENKYTNLPVELGRSTQDGFYVSESNKLEDLKIPYINIDSDEARNINSKLENLYLEYAKKFDQLGQCIQNQEDVCSTMILTYKTYYTEDTVSVIIIYGTTATTTYSPSYLSYVFSLENGKVLSVEDIAEKRNLTKEQLLNKSIESLKTYINSSDNNLCQETDYLEQSISYVKSNIAMNGSINVEENEINKDGIVYFLDEDNINMITKIYNNCETGSYPFLIKFK